MIEYCVIVVKFSAPTLSNFTPLQYTKNPAALSDNKFILALVAERLFAGTPTTPDITIGEDGIPAV